MPMYTCNILKQYIAELLLTLWHKILVFSFFFELVTQANKQVKVYTHASETQFTQSTCQNKSYTSF